MPDTPQGISVILIVKNCAAQLKDCLASLNDFLRPEFGDEIVIVDTGSTDKNATLRVAKEAGANIFPHPELNSAGMLDLVRKYLPEHAELLAKEPQFSDGFLSDFAAARELCHTHAKNELCFWLDSDDIFTYPPDLRDTVAAYFAKPENTCLFFAYDYAFEPNDGACTTVLWRERIYRKSNFVWKGICHETLVPKDGVPQRVEKIDRAAARIIHKHPRHHTFSDVRNYVILRHAYETADWKDPRWELYLGNASRGLARYTEAIQWYTRTLQHSGSPEDRLTCALNIAYAYILFGRPWRAIDWFFQAIKIVPSDPRSYYGVARAYHDLKRYQECLRWTQIGHATCASRPELLTAVDPNHYDFYPKIFETLSCKELGDVNGAVHCAQEALLLRPNFQNAKDLFADVKQWAAVKQTINSVGHLIKYANSGSAACDIIHSLKPEVRKLIPELQLETYATPPKKSVTFLCGYAHEPWDHTCLNSGIGGSEKMAILLATEFAKRGYRVDIYGRPKDGNAYKSFDGVTYLPHFAFNPELPRDIVIGWRNWATLDLRIKYRKFFMDLHDVQQAEYVSPGRLARLSAAIFKSNYHLAPLKDVLGPKGIVLRNAVDPAHFQHSIPRDLKRIVYCSSGDRGLKRALKLFAKIKTLVPDAVFDFFYGFTPTYLTVSAQRDYQYFGDEGCARHLLDYAEECFCLAERVGAVNHGRIGHEALAKELCFSSILLYPTKFPEISCMAVMEAQAAGCIPVVSRFAALEETTKHGSLIDPDDDAAFVRTVSEILTRGHDLDDYRAAMAAEAIKSFNISDLAAAWIQLFEAPDAAT